MCVVVMFFRKYFFKQFVTFHKDTMLIKTYSDLKHTKLNPTHKHTLSLCVSLSLSLSLYGRGGGIDMELLILICMEFHTLQLNYG